MKKFFGFVVLLALVAVIISAGAGIGDSEYHTDPIGNAVEGRMLRNQFRSYVNNNMPLDYLTGKDREERVEDITNALVEIQLDGYGRGYYGCWIAGEVSARTHFVNVTGNDLRKVYSDRKYRNIHTERTKEEQEESLKVARLIIYDMGFCRYVMSAIVG